MSDFVELDEFERNKRFQKEQFQSVAVKIVQMEDIINRLKPTTPLAPQTRDLLGKQVEKMFRDIQYLHQEILKIKKHLNIK